MLVLDPQNNLLGTTLVNCPLDRAQVVVGFTSPRVYEVVIVQAPCYTRHRTPAALQLAAIRLRPDQDPSELPDFRRTR